ncbi:hypothetical protein MUO32_25945 [Shinella sp. CPCC 101442]|uniref:hypothetical protein n=1 Tax=Shinella sp. CPCC 101442 TaxID=2932265 RepID=UPI0021538012|nr:hypothetical protein [Shinella sp. CPCC 101442]MCR6502474.1 hypothetical protein [Shinella sp. CPCC 101442]
MLKTISAALAAAASKIIGSIPTIGKWFDDIVSMPLRTLFSGGREAPSYTPDIPASDYVDVLKNAREAATSQATKFDRNIMESILEYCRAHPDIRATMKLPTNLDPRIQARLLTMNDAALRALARGGASQLKRFLEGIPSDQIKLVAANDGVPTMSPRDHVLWKVRANAEKDAEPFVPLRAMSL